MTQNLNFKLVKWQEAISQVEKTGFKWHLILRLPILQSDLKCSHIHRKKKIPQSLSPWSTAPLAVIFKCFTSSHYSFSPCPPPSPASILIVMNHPLEGPISLQRWHRSLDRALFGKLGSRWEQPQEKYQPVTFVMSRRFRNSLDANAPIIICISQFPSDLFFQCGWK